MLEDQICEYGFVGNVHARQVSKHQTNNEHNVTLGSAVVEPWVKLVDDRLKTDDGEETTGDGDDGNQDQDGGLEHPCDGA